MDRKYNCCSQIPGLIIFFLITGWAYASNSGDTSIIEFDKEIRSKTGTLDSIKTELNRGRTKLKELQKEEGNYLARLEQIEKNIGVSRTYLKVLTLRIDTVKKVIEQLQDSLQIEGKKLVERQEVMKKRLRQAYMTGTLHPLLMILNSRNPLDFINKTRYLEELKRYDEDLMNEISRSRKDIDLKKTARQEEREHLEKLIETKKDEQQVFEKEQDTRKSMLENVRSMKKGFAAMISELEAAHKELNQMIRLLEKKKRAKLELKKGMLAFDKKKGKLPWPVKGPDLNQIW